MIVNPQKDKESEIAEKCVILKPPLYTLSIYREVYTIYFFLLLIMCHVRNLK